MGRKIKLVQALLTPGEGGAQTYFEKMVFAFANEPDIDQQVITVAEPKRLERFEQAGIPYLAVGSLRSDKQLMKFIQSQLMILRDKSRIKAYLENFKPDVILAYHGYAPSAIHYPGAVHIARLGHECPMKRYKNCDYLVTNQPPLRHLMVAKGWPKDRIEVISNFAEFPDALQAEDELPLLPRDAKVVLTLGRLHPAKAQDTLIEALALLPENIHLLVAGKGALEKSLKELSARLMLSDRVHFLGLRRDVPRLMARADVIVLPSRSEPLGNVILEAWQAKKPIVAADSDGPRWLIDHGKNGLLFEIDNVKDCAMQITRIFNQSARDCETMIVFGQEKLNAQFSKEKIISNYKKLFRRLLR